MQMKYFTCCVQMIRKSVETRDWLHTMEPRSVRSVMKRVVEEVTLLDKQVSTLYEDGTKKEQGSGDLLCTCMMLEGGWVGGKKMRVCVLCTHKQLCLVLHVHVYTQCRMSKLTLPTAEGGSRSRYSLTQGGKGYPYSRYTHVHSL